MADKLQKVPGKGILKSSSFDKNDPLKSHKEMKWDEMNILQTLHPPGKDYGHMKINEPKTPYSYYRDSDDNDKEARSDDEADGIDADLLAKKIQIGSTKPPKALIDEDESEEDEDETEEQRAKRKIFEQKRKMHYNEYYAVKLARKLMEQEDDDDDEEEEEEDEEDVDRNKKIRDGEEDDSNEQVAGQEIEMSSSDVPQLSPVPAMIQEHPCCSRGKPTEIQKN